MTNPVAVALDVGGTKIAAGLVAEDGTVHMRRQVATGGGERGDPDLINTLALARELVAAADPDAIGLGVGFPEVVTPEGALTTREVVDWTDRSLHDLRALATLTVVDSDVRCGALAEAWFGVGSRVRDFIYVSVGTGLSHTHVINRSPRPGVGGAAIWMGALPVDGHLAGHRGAIPELERFASGRAISERFRPGTGTAVATPRVFEAADRGDRTAAQVIETAGAALGAGIAHLVLLLDPGAVVVGGGMIDAPDRYWRPAFTRLGEVLRGRRPRPLDIYRARHGSSSGLVGAACAVFDAAGISPPTGKSIQHPWFTAGDSLPTR